MKTEWLGRYRSTVESIILFANIYAISYNKEFVVTSGGNVSYEQIQIIEYLLENEELQLNMKGVAERLGKSPSSFTKLVNKLEEKGLLEKFHSPDNRKNIIVLVSKKGQQVYDEYVEQYAIPIFQPFFDAGVHLTDADLQEVAKMIRGIDIDFSERKRAQVRKAENSHQDLRDTLIKIES